MEARSIGVAKLAPHDLRRTCARLFLPDDDEMREALDVGEPRLKLGQDLEHSIGLVFGAEILGNLACVRVRTTHKSNRLRGKHKGTMPPSSTLMRAMSASGVAGPTSRKEREKWGTLRLLTC